MPRARRRANDTPQMREFEAAVREVERAEERLEKAVARMKSAMVTAVGDTATNLTVTEAARRMNYTREYVHKLIAQALKAQVDATQGVTVAESVTLSDSVTADVTPATPGHANGPDPE